MYKKQQIMNHSHSIFLCCLLMGMLHGSGALAQKWDLKNCNPDSIKYPYQNGRGAKTFPEGSCPPPKELTINCFNNSRIKPVKAESQSHETYYTHTADYAIDKHLNTRWSAGDYVDEQWFQVDLGRVTVVKQVILTWEMAYATDYLIQASDDKQDWKTVATVKGSDGFVDKVFVNAKARYIRMQSLKKANQFGISLFDFTLCAEANDNLE